jgi:ABC-type transporter MlaC component
MAVALMYDLPEMTRPRYEDAMRAVNLDRQQPTELKVHAAWEKDEGGWQIFEVWESYVAWEASFQERYSQVLRGRGREFSITVLSANVHQVYAND